MYSEFIEEYEFELVKWKQPIPVKNIDRMYNRRGAIKYEIEVNLYYQIYI